MSPVVLYFASGESLYAGVVLLLLSIATSPFLRPGWPRLLRNVCAWVALALLVMASPPFSWVVGVVFLAVFFLWFVAENRTEGTRGFANWRMPASLILAGLLIMFSTRELLHRSLPAISGNLSDHLVVIGDSISAGVDPKVSPWPAVMQRKTGVPVKNLSLPGADLAEGLRMAERLTPVDRVVLVELGGNDLLSGLPSQEFERRLGVLLAEVASPGRAVVMFELPLLPHWIAYGRAQRRLSAEFGVFLIPKRYFAAVVSGGSATLDGLHLSDVGADRMAVLVARSFSSVLQKN